MKNILLLLISILFSFNIFGQIKVTPAEFGRRPQLYQGKTILLSNIPIIIDSEEDNQENNRLKDKTTSTGQKKSHQNSSHLSNEPNCRPPNGWNIIKPQIVNLNRPLCFAINSKIYNRLPKDIMLNCEILLEVDIRGICKINRIRVRR